MDEETKFPESHKVPLLLASMGSLSQIGGTVTALRTKDIDKLTWETVTSDFIQAWKQVNAAHTHIDSNPDRNRV